MFKLIPLMCYGDTLALFFPFKWKELLGSLCFRRGRITYLLGEFMRNEVTSLFLLLSLSWAPEEMAVFLFLLHATELKRPAEY